MDRGSSLFTRGASRRAPKGRRLGMTGRDQSTRRMPALLMGLACILLCGCPQDNNADRRGFAIDDAYEWGPLDVHVRVDPNTVSIADLLILEFEASIADGYAVRMPAIDQVLQHFGMVDWHNPGDRLGDANRRIKTLTYELEPFLSGEYELPPFTFEFYDVNDPNRIVKRTTDPIPVTVTSLLGEERDNLTIADIETVVTVPRPPLPAWAWALGAVALLGAAGMIILWIRRKKVEALIRIFKPAHEVAYARLHALVDRDLIAQGLIKPFYEEISHILRHYIEDRFELLAPERTTEEFFNELEHSDDLSLEDQKRLHAFLQHCDLVKFAKHDPTSEEIQQTFDLVKDFIEKTRSDQHQIDVTDRLGVAATEATGEGPA